MAIFRVGVMLKKQSVEYVPFFTFRPNYQIDTATCVKCGEDRMAKYTVEDEPWCNRCVFERIKAMKPEEGWPRQ